MTMFDPQVWARVPFQFWTLMFFMLGCIVGSFLNVCIHRMPRGESIVSPPSHCPHCNYVIPWYLNIPLVTWLWLQGRCANCKAPIAMRYFLVELLTGILFAASWIHYGRISVALAIIYCLVLAGLIVAAFIDFEHFIIPDEITIGGLVVALGCSFFVPYLHTTFPDLHYIFRPGTGLRVSIFGAVFGAGVIYAIVRLGKLIFGRQKVAIPPGSKVVFTESVLVFPGHEVAYSDVFYRDNDTIMLQAEKLELIDRCYPKATVRLQPKRLYIDDEVFDPEQVMHMEAITDEIVLPREAMGLGDVKFMAAIGAFLGWPSIVFCLAISSFIGALVGITLIALKKRERSSQLPYGPYLAVAAVIWIFGGREWMAHWFGG